VDGIERDLRGKANVLRLNAMDEVGGQLAARYGVRGVPTLILLDGSGKLVLQQAGMPQRDEINAAVDELLK
jgi:thioredoxin-related protein